jgi:lysozyme
VPDPNEKLIDLISLHEGVKYRVYDDANGKEIKAGDTLVGHPTIGVGRNVASDGPGITKDEIDYLLSNDIRRVIGEAKDWIFFNGLSKVRQAVIIDMLFNMGRTRFNPGKWPKFFKAIQDHNWKQASIEMLDSSWAKQVKTRAERLSRMMQTDKW